MYTIFYVYIYIIYKNRCIFLMIMSFYYKKIIYLCSDMKILKEI
jgi:hypothetical protein